MAGEYLNFLYQDDLPLRCTNDFLNGLQRLYPRCRLRLPTANLYFRNWQKATKRVRALPLAEETVRSMATCAVLRKKA